MLCLRIPFLVLIPGMAHIFHNFGLVHRKDLAEVLVLDDAPRQPQVRSVRRSVIRELAAGEEVTYASAITCPVLVERGDREQVGDIYLRDEIVCLLREAGDERYASGVQGILAVGINRDSHAAHKVCLGVRVLRAEERLDLDDMTLPVERL